ncbi:hypothetical protein BDV96DRAFT_570579 [Lophiotrema nucula]|uniref:Uncharacterized protein n=1 Tax=Lophiotrema nucula TaxID=690887 RepID=A0A6A5ZEG9_9PLEO|nr:hypothetical protein BDV96DRAFT_570579 [Lophiotrema nucula]
MMIYSLPTALIALLPSLTLGLPQPSTLQLRDTDSTAPTNYPSYITSLGNQKRDVVYDLTVSNCPCEGDTTTFCLGYHYELTDDPGFGWRNNECFNFASRGAASFKVNQPNITCSLFNAIDCGGESYAAAQGCANPDVGELVYSAICAVEGY